MSKCHAKVFIDNHVIKYHLSICVGNSVHPRCEYYDQCLKDYKKEKKARGEK